MRSLTSAALGAVVLLALASGARAGGVVAAVTVEQVEGAGGGGRHPAAAMLPLSPGDEYSPELVERGRRLLESTGLFGLVEAEAVEEPGGWKVTFRVAPYELVDELSISGNFLVLRKDLERAVRTAPGDRFSEEEAARETAALLKIYEDQGYSGTQVATAVARGRRGVSVAYRISEGKPGIVRNVEFTGNASFAAESLAPLLKINLYTFYTQEQITESVERVESFYREEGFLNVAVDYVLTRGEGVVLPGLTLANPVKALATLLPGQYEVVDVVLKVDEGARFRVEIDGVRSYSDEDIRSRLTFAETGFFDEHEAETGRRRILEFYRARGYHDAQVTLEHDAAGRKARYVIDEGKRFTVRAVDFRGVEFFPRDRLLGRLRTWRREAGEKPLLRTDYLEEDAKKIRDDYRFEGFLDAEVATPEVVLDRGSGEAEVTFTVKEGRRLLIEEVRIEGAAAVPEEKLRNALRSAAGLPYRPGNVTRDKEKILAIVTAEGYPDCRVREKATFGPGGAVDLHFLVDQGAMRRVGRVIVVGGRKTKDKVVLREFPLSAGDPFSIAALVEGKRNLYGLGFFSEVRLQAPEPVGEGGAQDLVIRIRERPTGLFKVGVGYNSEEREGGFVELGEQNLFGTGRGVSLRAKASTIERRYDFFLREPWPFGYRINSEANLFEEFREEKGYGTVRRGVSVGVKRDFLEYFTLNLKYRFEFVDYENVRLSFDDPVEAAAEINALERINISSAVALLGFDLRDDPVNPHRGSYHLAGVEVATSFLGGDTDFNKYTFETSWYLPFTERSEFALGLRGGFAQTLAGFDGLPLSERYFLGGARGVRGYPEDGIGPKDAAGNPIGGDAYALGLAELRFPLAKKHWRGVLFFDVGNVWADLEGVEPTGAKASVGLGLRYNTPVGPLRLDYGIRINRGQGEAPGRLHFNIGFPF